MHGLDSTLITHVPHVPLHSVANRNGAVLLLARLGVGDAQKHKVLAHLTQVPSAELHQPTLTGVGEDSFHLDATRLLAIREFALRGVHQELDALLNGFHTLLLGILLTGGASRLRLQLKAYSNNVVLYK